jgi:hypothetical protein
MSTAFRRKISCTSLEIPLRLVRAGPRDCPQRGETTPDGRFIIVIYEQLDELTVIPVTAYEVAGAGDEM